jgi:hypothetical protein
MKRLPTLCGRAKGLWALCVTVLPACSSSDKAQVDNICAFAEDNNNCWRQMVSDIEACTGQIPSGEQGTLNADGTACTYPSGRTIQFAIPLAVNTDLVDKDVDFTVLVGGRTCLHYVSNNASGSLSATGPDGKVLNETSNPATGTATVTCPDGSQFSGSGLSVLNCLDASFGGGLPGTYYSWSTNNEELGLTGGQVVFACYNG